VIEIKNKKRFVSLFFVLLGLGVIISTYIEYGFSPKGRFGMIGGFIALAYALIRSKLIVKK